MYIPNIRYIFVSEIKTNDMKNFTARVIKGQIATGAYSHQKNNVKFYVVVWNDKQYLGTDLETLFNSL